MERLTSMLSAQSLISRPYPATPERRAEIDAAYKAEERRKEMERLERTRIPRRFQAISLDSVPQKVADYARAFHFATSTGQGFSRNLYIVGEYGTGKTEAACAALRHAMSAIKPNGQHPVVRFVTLGEIKREVTATWHTEGSESEVLSRYAGVSLLCIDDLGKELNSKPALDALFSVINARYNAMKPTIFTSQYGKELLTQRCAKAGMDVEDTQAVLRRIMEDCEIVRTVRHG